MSDSSVVARPYSAGDFLSAENLDRADETATEIFKVMFGLSIQSVDTSHCDLLDPEDNERTAVVGFSGAMRGSCQIRVSTAGVQLIASAMLGGMPVEEDDDSLNDALGELCNMLAGGWKNGVPSLSAACALSPPTVISGKDYKVHVRMPSVKLLRTYLFDGHTLQLTLHCEDIESAR